MIVYRLGSSRYPPNDGTGASLYGGRWNRKGTAVIYTAESRALCALEVLANADELADDYVVTTISIPVDVPATEIGISELPFGWDAAEPADITREIGTAWARELRSAVLIVPSVVIPRESNCILNPAHPLFGRVQFSNPEPFYFDGRLGRAWLKRKERE